MCQCLRHHRIVLLIVIHGLRIRSFAVDRFAGQRVSRLFQDFFGALFVFEENETERSTFLFGLVDRRFDLGDLNSPSFENERER